MGRPLKYIHCPQCLKIVAARDVREFVVCDACDEANKLFVRRLSAELRGFDDGTAVFLARMVVGMPGPGPDAPSADGPN